MSAAKALSSTSPKLAAGGRYRGPRGWTGLDLRGVAAQWQIIPTGKAKPPGRGRPAHDPGWRPACRLPRSQIRVEFLLNRLLPSGSRLPAFSLYQPPSRVKGFQSRSRD
jgi:hypothetical protein